MMRPAREHATNTGQTYMISAPTWGRRALFSREAWAKLLIDTLYHYRGTAYLLHEFVVMPDHIHVLLTPKTSLEKAVQFIKGGFSYRAKKELGSNLEVWQKGFSDHRIRDASDYHLHVIYVQQNPVRRHLCQRAEDYPYSSARIGFDLDLAPQGRKPAPESDLYGAPEGAPLQSMTPATARREGVPVQSKSILRWFEGGPFQNNSIAGSPEGALALSEPSGEPQGLKPIVLNEPRTARLKGVPFQNKPKNKTA